MASTGANKKDYMDKFHFDRRVKQWARYGLVYTNDMKGKSLQKELKKHGMTLADMIPEIADDTAAIRKDMATSGEQKTQMTC